MSKDTTAVLPNGESFKFWDDSTKYEKELHVDAKIGSDDNDGTLGHPFKTINAAASIAVAGDKVLIHAGEYRECVNPINSGESESKMIAYEAAGDGDVIVKASCVATQFKLSEGWNLYRGMGEIKNDRNAVVWQTKLNPDDFRGYNPFNAINMIHDRLFIEYDKTDMTTYLNRRGMIFVDNKPLYQVQLPSQLTLFKGSYWIEANGQTVHFRLPDDGDPKDHLIELTCREQCFAPEESFVSYIKVKGLICAHAATGAPVPQRGAISAHRGHHWIIEDCTVDWSNCIGIDIGVECWHRTQDPDRLAGYSIVRGCKIYDSGVCGIAGMFVKNILIEDNLIEGTGWQKMELSWEAGGIKVHNCVNSLYRRNIFRNTIRCDAMWMDVGNINNRITQNLFLNGLEAREHLFMECTRDAENLIDNNIFWNIEGRFDEKAVPKEPGSSGWYKMGENDYVNGYAIYGEGTDHLHIANNFIGKCRSAGYFQKTVAFRLAGRGGTARDTKMFNNVFYDCKEAAIKFPTDKNESEGNVFAKCFNGYLRILFPAPTECLDLATWREFHGFDMTGSDADFDVDIDTENLTMTIKHMAPNPMMNFFRRSSLKAVEGYENLPSVKRDKKIENDFFGEKVSKDTMAGPFTIKDAEVTFSIDPRK